jgi:thiol-disulfide isomerase/thioredoxin
MKKIFKLLLSVGLGLASIATIVAFGVVQSSADRGPPIGGAVAAFRPSAEPKLAPDTRFRTLEGAEVGFESFAGKVALVNFWATWCAPCVKEMPSLDRLQAKLGTEKFVVLTLSADLQGAPVVRQFFEVNGLKNLIPYLDPRGLAARAFAIRGLPTSILLDGKGRELGRLEGDAEWDQPEALALIRHYLGREAEAKKN